jgi:hypothetical protein
MQMTSIILAAQTSNWTTDFLAKFSSELLAVFLGGLFGAALLKFVEWFLEKYPPQRASRARQKSLSGSWNGKIVQLEKRSKIPHEMDVDFHFDVGWRVIKGTMSFASPFDARGRIIDKFRGRFVADDILKLEYENHDPKIVGFGTTFLMLSLDGTNMTGKLVGLSSHVNELFATKINISKQP